MARSQRICLFLLTIATVEMSACSDSNTTPVEKRLERIEFIPGRYHAEIIEIESDCEPALEEILAATDQPRAGIVELVWQEGGEPSVPVAGFLLANPRLDNFFWVPSIFPSTHCDTTDQQNRPCSFFPDETISNGAPAYYSLGCYRPVGAVTPDPKIMIFQGFSPGVFEVEITHPWNDSMIVENACLPLETYPRKACTERFVTRYTLERECPLNCSALDSDRSVTTIDIFPDIEGNYVDFTLPEDLYQCVPFKPQFPLIGGECPEEFIVRP